MEYKIEILPFDDTQIKKQLNNNKSKRKPLGKKM